MRLRPNADYEADFSEEEDVRREIAEALGVPEKSLRLEFDSTNEDLWTVYERGAGRPYSVVFDAETAEAVAEARVLEQLVDKPESFGRAFLERLIDRDQLYEELFSEVSFTTWQYADALADRDAEEFWRVAESVGIPAQRDEEDGVLFEPDGADVEALGEKLAARQIKDPVQYLIDLHGETAGIVAAFHTAGMDEELGAHDAVMHYGAEHFLGPLHGTASGFVYWRSES